MGSIAFFVGVPEQREAAHLRGGARDGEMIWEVRCIPGNLIGVGKTLPEAKQSLVRLLTWVVHDKRQPFEDWYREAWSYADRSDNHKFEEVLVSVARSLQKPTLIENRVGLELAGCGS